MGEIFGIILVHVRMTRCGAEKHDVKVGSIEPTGGIGHVYLKRLHGHTALAGSVERKEQSDFP
jgi:hypothetical protein